MIKKQAFILSFSAAMVFLLALYLADSSPTRAQTTGYLHTDGAQIVDANGNQVILTGISWFGLETENFTPHGLWARNWESILDQIVKLGFNTLRVPYSNQLFDAGSSPNGINEELNPDLIGLSGLEILDKLVQGAGERGLKVILDRHRPDSHAQSELWYTTQYSEDRWIQDWVMLAERYQGNDTVIGVDLHNEPHGPATWGSGDPATDWRLAAEKAGNAVLAVNPNLLIIVEGVEVYQDDWYWWGGNLLGARENPVRLEVPNQLVYSTHVYGPGVYPQPWFASPDFPENLAGIWDEHWGYLVREGIAPIIVGEFGGRSVGDDQEGVWQRTLVSYLRDHDISYIYWTINPNSGDTGGLLLDDWETIDPAKQELLSGYQFSIIGIEQNDPQTTADATRPTPQDTLEPTTTPEIQNPALNLTYRTANPTAQSQDAKPEFILTNTGMASIPLVRAEIRYWFMDNSGQPLSYHCDWANLGCGNVLGEFASSAQGEQYLRLHFPPSAGEIAPGEDTGEIKIRFNRADWSEINQEDDFSFAPQPDYAEWRQITVYFDGQLVWGVEPGGESAAPESTQAIQASDTPIPSPTPTQTWTSTPEERETPAPTITEQVIADRTTSPATRQISPALYLLAGAVGGLVIALLLFRFVLKPRSTSSSDPDA